MTAKWNRVSRSKPCPICHKPDWCAFSGDGQRVRCQRVEMGAVKTATDKNGVTYYLHRLNGEQRPHVEVTRHPPGSTVERADADTLHAVYDALLGGLRLSKTHREQLRKRGLPDAEIDRRLYRSLLPVQGRVKLARELSERFGSETLLSVPGFVVKKNKSGENYLTIAGWAGLLIPVRDLAGRIVALKVRRDGTKDELEAKGLSRYSYLSSSNCGGPGSGSPVHVPSGVATPTATARLTEGELKADIATSLSGMPTISIPGVAGWSVAIPVLRQLGTKTVLITFDADAAENKHVARALSDCFVGLAKEGFAVAVECWDAAHKGIDDLLAAGQTPEVLQGDAALAYVSEALATAGEPSPPPIKDDDDGAKGGKRSVAEKLVEIAMTGGVKLIHTPDEVAYAIVPGEDYCKTLRLRSTPFSSWLKRSYYLATSGKTPGAQAVNDALGVLEGIALHDGPAESVHLRVAENAGRLYIDLTDDRWRAVEVDAAGWRIVNNPPVRFRRSRAMLPLPEPIRGGSLDQLRPFLNLSSDEDWRLAVAWLLAALRPVGPYPLLVLSGQQGSAKSTTARVLRSLIDPNKAPIRSEPKEERDLMIAANASWILALDNLSSVPVWLSDALCRLSTGGGSSTRQLFSDDEETIFDAQRPVILTSIEDVTTRGDLLERSLIPSLPSIPEDKRVTEKEMKAKFDPIYPLIFGSLLDALSGSLRELPHVKLPTMPRMADFAVGAVACERALGWPAGSFLSAYDRNRSAANEVALESSPIVPPLRQLLAKAPEWSGSPSELLDALAGIAGEQAARGREWPKRANALSGALKRLAPNLAAVGIVVSFHRDKKTRSITIKQEKVRETSTSASSSSSERENKAFMGDDPLPGHRHSGNEDRHHDNPGDDPGDDPVTIPPEWETPEKPAK